jgi:hypothetical protein
MTAVNLVTCRVPEDPAPPPPFKRGDTSWCVRHSTSGALVCHHTDFFLFAIVLWIVAVSLDPHGDVAHGSLCDPMRGLYGD